MTKRTLLTRRVQLSIIVLFALGAAAQVFIPPFTAKGRAEKLYNDAWSIGVRAWFEYDANTRGSAAEKLRQALELDPDNSLYQQGLVWFATDADRKSLLESGKLEKGAAQLAAALVADPEEAKSLFSSERNKDPKHLKELLQKLDDVARIDPQNAYVHYHKAFTHMRLKQTEDMLREIHSAVRLKELRFYKPEIGDQLRGTIVEMLISSPSYAEFRGVARKMLDSANEKLRHGKVDEARTILEDCCSMGVQLASSKPSDTILLLTGSSIFRIGSSELRYVYRDFGMGDRLDQLIQTEKAFQCGIEELQDTVLHMTPGIGIKETILCGALLYAIEAAVITGAFLALVILILWPFAAVIRRRNGQDSAVFAPWREGWLAGKLISLNSVLVVVTMLILLVFGETAGVMMTASLSSLSAVCSMVAIAFAPIILIMAVLKALKISFVNHSEERMGFFRFVFKSPAAVKAWTRKYIAVALLGQLIFLACFVLFMTIISEPLLGYHHWQLDRIKYEQSPREEVASITVHDINRAFEPLKSNR